MSVSNPSEIAAIDAEAVREAIEEVIDGPLRSLVEYDSEEFNPLYIDDTSLAFYEDEAEMLEHFERIHAYVNLDFTEIELFTEELLPITERLDYIATRLDAFTIIRVYLGEVGLFVAVDAGEPVEAIVGAIGAAVDADVGVHQVESDEPFVD